VDVADPAAIETAALQVERELGPIDIWVNSAFTSIFAPFAEISPEEFKRVTEVTYLGAVYATMAVLRRMRERDAGTIVQVGSTLTALVENPQVCLSEFPTCGQRSVYRLAGARGGASEAIGGGVVIA
jgi:NAD(P)-dependent dehydrogenase (short-subunit alcohol dehydrogenase family)